MLRAFEIGDRGFKGVDGGIRPARIYVALTDLRLGRRGELLGVREAVRGRRVEKGRQGYTGLCGKGARMNRPGTDPVGTLLLGQVG